MQTGGFGFLRSKPARVLTIVLLAQLAGLVALSRQEPTPLERPLSMFPMQAGEWTLRQEGRVEPEVLDGLKADDVLSRTYMDSRGRAASLFVAYFKSQRTGQTPHSPKNCLPGSGWTPSQSDIMNIAVAGRDQPLQVNRYIVARGEDRSLVLYWYQSRDRAVASEYAAKFYLVADAIRYNRTDTALVRVVVPMFGNDVRAATDTARNFVQASYGPLRHLLPR